MNAISRRDLMKTLTAGVAVTGISNGLNAAEPVLKGKADSCIFLWLGGGAAHVDTFDPKLRGDGLGKAGSYYDSIETAIPGARVCEHLRQSAPLLDRCVLI